MSLRAFGGGELIGEKLVRFAHLDEAGTANPIHDPHVVVAGVITHADRDWTKIRRHLDSLVERHIKPEHREGFYFHVKEIRYGSKRIPRDSYTYEEQNAIIRDLCAIPATFEVPIVSAYVDRAALREKNPHAPISTLTDRAQIVASMACIYMVERYMRTAGETGEIATLIFENKDGIRHVVKQAHRHLQTQAASDAAKSMGFVFEPIRAVNEGPFFAEKLDTPILQLADACAFAIKRHLAGQDRERFYSQIERNLFIGPTLIPMGMRI